MFSSYSPHQKTRASLSGCRVEDLRQIAHSMARELNLHSRVDSYVGKYLSIRSCPRLLRDGEALTLRRINVVQAGSLTRKFRRRASQKLQRVGSCLWIGSCDEERHARGDGRRRERSAGEFGEAMIDFGSADIDTRRCEQRMANARIDLQVAA